MNYNIVLMILGMAIVTYIPRAIPTVLIDKMKFGKKVEKFLRLIPYTAMSALIFPGVFSVDSEKVYIGIAGAVVAALLGWKRLPVMVCVLGAMGIDLILYALIP